MAGLALLAAVLGMLLIALSVFLLTQKTVTLEIDGSQVVIYTHRRTVGELLQELRLSLTAQDGLSPPSAATLQDGSVIRVRRARPALILADGQEIEILTASRTPLDILAEAGVALGRYDRILINGEPVDPAASLPAPPAMVEVVRAVALTVSADGQTYSVYTTAPTIGQTLHEMGISLYAADTVTPAIDQPPAEGMHITVERATPVTITVDGVTVAARTRATTVAGALVEAGFALIGEDYSIPSAEAPLPPDGHIRLVRVSEDILTERTAIPYRTIYQPDPNLELDTRRPIRAGVPGIAERRTRIRYEDGVEVSRITEPSRVVLPPTDAIIAYGTRIVVRTLDTPDGPLAYWRVIRMLATSYAPSTSSKPPDAPSYGLAGTGLPVQKGIVAVDPAVIPYFTRVYVPGYGIGLAADSGGAVNGRRIDLGYSDNDLELWYSWVDVYLLTPIPPEDEILYLLP
ncbi:MAG: DUF348 domain-containing protein [Anaerolineae bacterium]|nr:DUF348 domain-containing protein [Anaerolineae bacterium]